MSPKKNRNRRHLPNAPEQPVIPDAAAGDVRVVAGVAVNPHAAAMAGKNSAVNKHAETMAARQLTAKQPLKNSHQRRPRPSKKPRRAKKTRQAKPMCRRLTSSNNRLPPTKVDRVRHAAGGDVVVDAAAPANAAKAVRVRHRQIRHRLNQRARKTAPNRKPVASLERLNKRT